MKQSLRRALSAVLLSGVVGIACANTTDVPPVDNSATPSNTDASTGPAPTSIKVTDSGSVPESSTPPPSTQCVSNCTSDSECQTSCPAAPNGGINCCDTSSGVCYASSTSSCGGAVDGGTD